MPFPRPSSLQSAATIDHTPFCGHKNQPTHKQKQTTEMILSPQLSRGRDWRQRSFFNAMKTSTKPHSALNQKFSGSRPSRDRAETGGSASAIPPACRAFSSMVEEGGSADAALRRIATAQHWAENSVVRLSLSKKLDLGRVAWWYNAYFPHRFDAFTVRQHDVRSTTVLLFRTGLAVTVGAQTIEHTYQGMHRVRLSLESIGVDTSIETFNLVNMVYFVVIDQKDGIDIARVFADYMASARYSPGKFPGILLVDNQNGVKYRIFDNNVILVMGARSAYMIPNIIEHAKRLISPYSGMKLPSHEDRYEKRKETKRRACIEVKIRVMQKRLDRMSQTGRLARKQVPMVKLALPCTTNVDRVGENAPTHVDKTADEDIAEILG